MLAMVVECCDLAVYEEFKRVLQSRREEHGPV